MPFQNEHSARLRAPGAFQADSFRRKSATTGISLILGRLKGETTMTTQAVRFDKSRYTQADLDMAFGILEMLKNKTEFKKRLRKLIDKKVSREVRYYGRY